MKNNKNSKTKPKKKPTSNTSDYSSLNSELGIFDLEPPKNYREDVRNNNQPKKKGAKPQPTQQNKRKVQKKKRKRSKIFYKAVSIIAMVLAIVAVIVTLSLTVFFKIEKINIAGNEKYTNAEIVEALPIEVGKNLFLSNTENAKQNLEKQLPYVFNAEIKRKLPSTIVVKITETPKVYAIKNLDKTYVLLDENLKVLEKNALKKPKKSIVINDVSVKSAVVGTQVELNGKKTVENLFALTDIVSKLDLKEVTAVSSVDINTNSLTYDKRIVIKLGDVSNLENKIYSALTAIDKLNESDPNATGTIVATNDKQIYFTEE